MNKYIYSTCFRVAIRGVVVIKDEVSIPNNFLTNHVYNSFAVVPLNFTWSFVGAFFISVLFPTDLTNLQKVSYSSQEAIGGNVHTGAPPPWLNSVGEMDTMQKPELSNLVNSKVGKSSKLNPKRVGAAWAETRKLELEMEKKGEVMTKNYDANWLPNFGGVWQSGTRRKSRKEFQVEHKTSLEFDNQSEISFPLQPYISKRMVRNSSLEFDNQLESSLPLQPCISKRMRRDNSE